MHGKPGDEKKGLIPQITKSIGSYVDVNLVELGKKGELGYAIVV